MTGSSRVGVRPISLRLLLKCWAKLGQEKRKKKKKKSHSALSRYRMTFPWALASRGGWLRYDDIDIILCCGVQTECYSCLKISPPSFCLLLSQFSLTWPSPLWLILQVSSVLWWTAAEFAPRLYPFSLLFLAFSSLSVSVCSAPVSL